MINEQPPDAKLSDIQKQYPRLYPITLAILCFLGGLWLGSRLFPGQNSGYAVNLYTTGLDVFLTVAIIEVLHRQRNEKETDKALKEQLVREAGSISNEIAKNAVHHLRKKGWLTGENGLLKAQDLEGADLSGANLTGANLEEANLKHSKLIGAILNDADLKKADLTGADMSNSRLHSVALDGAKLSTAILSGSHSWDASFRNAALDLTQMNDAELFRADFRESRIWSTNFRGANIAGANFKGVDLYYADLRGARLNSVFANDGATILFETKPSKSKNVYDTATTMKTSGMVLTPVEFDTETILPGGTKWSPDIPVLELIERFGVIYEFPDKH